MGSDLRMHSSVQQKAVMLPPRWLRSAGHRSSYCVVEELLSHPPGSTDQNLRLRRRKACSLRVSLDERASYCTVMQNKTSMAAAATYDLDISSGLCPSRNLAAESGFQIHNGLGKRQPGAPFHQASDACWHGQRWHCSASVSFTAESTPRQ